MQMQAVTGVHKGKGKGKGGGDLKMNKKSSLNEHDGILCATVTLNSA